MRPILYMQSDPKWAAHDYSAAGEKTTIKAEGCGIACTAMVIASLADKGVTPITTAEWSKAHGYKAKGQGTYYSYFKPQGEAYGIKINMLGGGSAYKNPNSPNHKKALDAIRNGEWVIACMGRGNWTTSGHYVLWYGMDGSKVLINDPWSGKPAQTNAEYDLFRSEVKYYWIVTIPERAKEDKEMVVKDKVIVNGQEFDVEMIRKDGYTYIKTQDIGKVLDVKVSNKGRIPVLERH